jgi:uncharacterized protein YwqG
MWSTRDELEAVLREHGLGSWASRLAAAARHAVILEPGPVEEGADAPIGASRIGGMPDLPPDMPWPSRRGFLDPVWKKHAERPWPLSFIAQVDFGEIHRAGGLEGFPSSGRLLLFCDPVEYPWGMTAEDQACASVIFLTEEADQLRRRAFPAEFNGPQPSPLQERDFIFRPRRLTPKLWLLPPPDGSRELLAPDGSPASDWKEAVEHEAYQRFWRDLAARHPGAFGAHWPSTGGEIHQVGGIPFSIGDPVETDCVKFAEDDYSNHPTQKAWFERARRDGTPMEWRDFEEQWQAFSAFTARERTTHFERAESWQLVLQIDSDYDAGMQWGDAGRLYVCIRKSDLAERRFDRCWTLLQCS